MDDLFWNGTDPLIHTAVMVIFGYIALIVMLRLSGPRTMAKMTPLDFLVAVTIGSAFGRTLTAVDVAVAQTIVAIGALILLQWALAGFRARFPKFRRLVDSEPVLLYYKGDIQHKALRAHRLTIDDIHTAVRQSGKGSLSDIAAVILQQDGSLGAITTDGLGDASSVTPYVHRKDIQHNEG
ncbi:DUF421 domain-containing protein [Hoyosella subflava]|uniref:Membrane protein family protein n=1 Tax=Hoyosella subflava (strain DSM 45089 / JCM 17490 / NBRC 109087 / DQS3-9A1) TaxID=443218 RepID=F6EI41_HOYSD|nr:YetF domain-containing protein [Hoyosella subflava]AEF39990.1 Membrane protein family protein [Hoyosella subflava DQS3-9A1]